MTTQNDANTAAYNGPRALAADTHVSLAARRAALKDWHWRMAMVRRASAEDAQADRTARSIKDALDTLA